jgi:hypothetical protein
MPRVRVPRHVARLVTWLVVDYFTYAARPGASARRAACRRLLRLRPASGCLGTSHGSSRHLSSTTSPTPHVRVPRHVARLATRLVVDYFAFAARPVASGRRAACCVTHRRLLRLAQARRRLLRLRRVSGCVGTSRGSSRGSSCGLLRDSSSTTSPCASSPLTTPPRAGSSSTTSPPPRVRVPRHVARLVTRLVAPLVVDYSASHRLVIDYFAFVARPVASARRAARRAARRVTTSPPPRVWVPRHVARLVADVARLAADYFDYAMRPGASARRAARHAAPRAARRQLLRLHRASGCLGTSRGSSSTTSNKPRVWVPRHVARCIACRRLLRLRCASGCLGTSRGPSRGSSSTTPCAATSSCGHAGSI